MKMNVKMTVMVKRGKEVKARIEKGIKEKIITRTVTKRLLSTMKWT